VVVRVDEAGRDERSAQVDRLVRLGRRPRAGAVDDSVGDEEPAAVVLRAGVSIVATYAFV